MIPRARIARVSWWRRLLAWLRRDPITIVIEKESKLIGAPPGPWRCPPCVYQFGIEGYIYCRGNEPLATLGRNLSRVGYHLSRPAPTTMPGSGERVSK